MTRGRLGAGLVEALVAVGILSLVLAVGVAAGGRALPRARAPAAARIAVSEIRRIRGMAIAAGSNRALRFERDAAGRWLVSQLEDGDGDGIRNEDLRRGIDRLTGGPWGVAERWGVAPGFALSLTSLDSPPPDGRPLGDLADPVRFGTRDIVSCSPRGTITPGTVYLSDGHERQLAVVVAGTARVRVWEYLIESRRWILR